MSFTRENPRYMQAIAQELLEEQTNGRTVYVELALNGEEFLALWPNGQVKTFSTIESLRVAALVWEYLHVGERLGFEYSPNCAQYIMSLGPDAVSDLELPPLADADSEDIELAEIDVSDFTEAINHVTVSFDFLEVSDVQRKRGN